VARWRWTPGPLSPGAGDPGMPAGVGEGDRLAGAGRWSLPRPVGEGGTPTAPSSALVHARGGGRVPPIIELDSDLAIEHDDTGVPDPDAAPPAPPHAWPRASACIS
jgi:hypothetical protein